MKNEIELNAYRCLQLFRDLLQAVDTTQNDITDQLSPLSLEDQLGKYKTWTGNLGALRRGHSSLDYRLRNTLFIAENIIHLLQSLQASLTRGVQLASGNLPEDVGGDEAFGSTTTSHVNSSSSSSDEGDISIPDRTPIQECYIDIVEIINKLLKLSIAIRSPFVRTATAKALSYVERDELGNDIFLLFEQFTIKRIRAWYPGLTEKLVERLGKSISRRRRLFLYGRRHRQKLEVIEQDVKVIEEQTPTLGPKTILSQTTATDYVPRPETPTLGPKTILSQTTATDYVPRPETPSQASSMISESAISGMSKESKVYIPPVHPVEGEDFECPYCFCILHAKTQRKKLWEKHVYEDLQPYVCLFEHCPIEDQLFSSYEEWLDHQKWKHNLRWHCDDASHFKYFSTQEGFEQHLITVHSEKAGSTALLQAIKRSCRPNSRLWMNCPFCGYTPKRSETSIQDPFQEGKMSSLKLEKHVGEHLKKLATLALPWRDDISDATENEISSSQISRSSSSSILREKLQGLEDPVAGGAPDPMDPSDYQEDPYSTADKIDEPWDFLPRSNFQPTEDSTILTFIKSFEEQQLAKNNIQVTQAPPHKHQPLDLEGEVSRIPILSNNPQHNLPSSERQGLETFYNQTNAQVGGDPVVSTISFDGKGKGKGKGKEAEDSLPALTTQPVLAHHIRGTSGETEKLDKSYIVRRYDYLKFFNPGRVFNTLWTDPYGGTANDNENSQFMTRVDYVSFGERVHTKIRRFVVIRQGDRMCTCLPVTTYDGKGYKKHGIKLDEHGLIYSEKHPGEVDGITKKALRVILSRNGERLRNPSYINYGRLYTVETNVKVKDVGELDLESRRLLIAYYRDVHFPPEDDIYIPTQRAESQAAFLASFESNSDPLQRYSSSTIVPSEHTATNSYQSSSQVYPSSTAVSSEYYKMVPSPRRHRDYRTTADRDQFPPQRYPPSTTTPSEHPATNSYQSPPQVYSSSTAIPSEHPATNSYQSPPQVYSSSTAIPSEHPATNRYRSPPRNRHQSPPRSYPSSTIVPSESDDYYALPTLGEARATRARRRSGSRDRSGLDRRQRSPSNTAILSEYAIADRYQSPPQSYPSSTTVPSEYTATNRYQPPPQSYPSNPLVPNEHTATNNNQPPPQLYPSSKVAPSESDDYYDLPPLEGAQVRRRSSLDRRQRRRYYE